ncbi:hypothetical protein A8C56_18455 [Niabella ginsenosidivorans]|uniref:Addiction module protein n=1 Tax=Niabella ginsenosidivorans TaxID=1176587 RepID=A0A1A9I843_9BACT|nr:hypothetical protein [Niabella ginsenosidivorans]ANH82694.1 hypothetical protein A8C56_18455 [Niabella ginsenosidivorans]
MTTAAIRDKLQEYIRFADDKKIKAIYTILEEEIETEYVWWKDEDFVARLDREREHFKSGKSKGYTWEEISSTLDELRAKRDSKK